MKPGIQESFRIRPASVSDAEQLAGLFSTVYQDSSHECKNAGHVRQSLHRPDRSWFVAVRGTQVAGCTAYQSHVWNASWEMGWTITHPEYRNAELCTQLLRTALDHLRRQRDFGLAFGFPRSLSMYRLVSESIAPPFIHTGHDGGLNTAGGLREYHLATVSTPRSSFTSVIPQSNEIAHSEFVRNVIFSPLSFSHIPGAYPQAIVVGPPGGMVVAIGRTRIRYQFDESSPAKDLHITALDSSARAPSVVCRDVKHFVARFPSALHVRAYVLVDKEDLVRHMRSLGFEIAAYLPAWHLHRERRYDCLLLVMRNYAGEPVTHDLAHIIHNFRYEFSRFYA